MLTVAQAQKILGDSQLLCSSASVAQAVGRVASEVSASLAAENPLVLCVMTGGVVFTGQLLPMLGFPLTLDYVHLTRYGNATTGGNIEWKVFPSQSIEGRVVLVVDDILDEGHTMAAIRERVLAAGAKRFCCAVFADKAIVKPKAMAADFVGVTLPDRYVFGFGLDVRGAWRNLADIRALNEEA